MLWSGEPCIRASKTWEAGPRAKRSLGPSPPSSTRSKGRPRRRTRLRSGSLWANFRSLGCLRRAFQGGGLSGVGGRTSFVGTGWTQDQIRSAIAHVSQGLGFRVRFADFVFALFFGCVQNGDLGFAPRYGHHYYKGLTKETLNFENISLQNGSGAARGLGFSRWSCVRTLKPLNPKPEFSHVAYWRHSERCQQVGHKRCVCKGSMSCVCMFPRLGFICSNQRKVGGPSSKVSRRLIGE